MNLVLRNTSTPLQKGLFVLLLCIVFISPLARAQNYADPKFYIIDSLELDNISIEDKLMLDSILTMYHQSNQDTTRLTLIEYIVDECWDEAIWPKYNDFLHTQATVKFYASKNRTEQYKFASLVAGAISNIGYVNDNVGNISKALENYHQSLAIYEKIGDEKGTSTCLNNLGVLYSTQGDTSKALYYHRQSLLLKQKLRDISGESLSWNNIGTIYEVQQKPFEALRCYEKSLRISKKINDQRGMAITYDNIAGIYENQGYPTKAIELYNNSLEIWKILGDDSGVAFCMNNIAEVYYRQKKIGQSKKYALESFGLAKKMGYPLDIKNAAFTLSQIYKSERDFETALTYFELYVSMRDSIFNAETERVAGIQALKYAYEKESLKDSLENSKIQAIKDAEINEQKAIIEKGDTITVAMIIGLCLMIITVLIGLRAYRRKRRDNELIQQQKQEVEAQKLKVEQQHQILASTYQEIADSITYAKRIQQAILPPQENLKATFNNYFVFYAPKNVVSGDFYWMKNLGDKKIIAAADCTGHGVPGAMVSVVCNNALNRAVHEFGLSEPNEILNKTRELVIETFEKSEDNVKDGMDISICTIDNTTKMLSVSGANNNAYIVRNNEMIEFKADRQPIGRFESPRPFSVQQFKLQENDMLYLFTDGIADQFGGPGGKKFKYKKLKELLLVISNDPMEAQKNKINSVITSWMGKLEQVDDMCLLGIRPL